jgi:hypothetical protein
MKKSPKSFSVILFLTMIVLSPAFLFAQDLENIAKQKPFEVHGNASLNLIGYGVSGIEPRRQPFSWVLSANVTASVYGIQFPFSFTISDQQKSYAQPFNQFGLSPHWKWITVHAGYRNITFSNYTLAGRTFVGAGVELNPSILRFGFVYGRFDRKTTDNPLMVTDSLPNFKSTGFAVKLGVGTEKNFFDLILLRIRDDSTSVVQSDTSAIRTPEQNVVMGFNSHFTFSKRLTLEVEGAFSLYTTNTGAEPFEDVENDKTLSALNSFLVINQSTEYYYAARAALQYHDKNVKVKAEYRRVEPKYRSMGAYFFNNDLENFTISPTVGFWKKKVIVGGSLGLQRDNLRASKKATSMRTIGSAMLSFNPSSTFGLDLNYSNYGMNQKAGRLPLVDSTKVHQVTNNLTVIPRLMFTNVSHVHMVMLTYLWMNLNDQNSSTSEFTRMVTHTAQLTYNLSWIESRWTMITGLNFVQVTNFGGVGSNWGITAGGNKALLDDKLNIGLNNALMRSDYAGTKGWVLNVNLNGTYQINVHHSLRLNGYYTGNFFPDGTTVPSFNEFKGDLMYVYTF